MGTPTYMSPEQCRGAGEVDHRSDIYAIGCILYEMVAGRPPFQAEGIGELIAAHMLMPPDPPTRHNPNISAATEGLILNLLAKNPAERVQSCAELARLLGQGSMPSASASLQAITAPTQAMSPLHTPVPTPLPPSRTVPGGLPGVPTTLSGAASQTAPGTVPPPAGKSKVGLFAAIGVVVVGGGIAAAVLLGGGGGGGKTTTANEGSASGVETATGSGATSGSAAVDTTAGAGSASAVAVTPDAAEAIVAATVDAGVPVDAASVATVDPTAGKTDGKTDGKTGSRGDRGGKRGGRDPKSGGGTKTGGDTGGTKTGGGTDATPGSGSATGKRVDRGD
jgi:serine/threonine-protein kinase